MNAPFAPSPAHAVYAPSSAHRWTECTASATAIAAMERMTGPQEDSEESVAGTAAHDEIERVLGPYAAGRGLEPLNADHPAAFGIALFVDYVRRLAPGTLWIEQRVRLTDHIWGRLDCGHWHAESATVTVVDYKNGYVGVDAKENEQFRIYAAALIKQYQLPTKWIRYVCVQPNDFMPVPRVKQWVEPVEDLQRWAAKTALIPDGPLTFRFGSHCRDCPLFGICEPTRDILARLGTAMARGPGGDVDVGQVALFLACKKPIDHFFEGLVKTATKKALAGATVPGMKLVTSVKHRAWKSPSEARTHIVALEGVDALTPPTPAQAEAMGIDIEGLADKPPGGPVLAPETDTRKPWAPRSAAEMFAGIPGLAPKQR